MDVITISRSILLCVIIFISHINIYADTLYDKGFNLNKSIILDNTKWNTKSINELKKIISNPYYNYKNIIKFPKKINNKNLTLAYLKLINFVLYSNINWDLVTKTLKLKKTNDNISAVYLFNFSKYPKTNQILSAIKLSKLELLLYKITPNKTEHKHLIHLLNKFKNPDNFTEILYNDIDTDINFNDRSKNIISIKKRLIQLGDLHVYNNYKTPYYDKILRTAVLQYKKRLNLDNNDKITNRFIYYLNMDRGDYIPSILTNLDKLKVYSKEKNTNEYLEINIPSFTLNIIKNNKKFDSFKVIVGKEIKPTPIINTYFTDMVINPIWMIPQSITMKELIPTLKLDHNYLDDHNIDIFQDNTQIKNFDINNILENIENKNIKYTFVQRACQTNVLGKIKYVIHNNYLIFLHDTDNKSLFNYNYRLFSSGCIRIENIFRLEKYLHKYLYNPNMVDVKKQISKKYGEKFPFETYISVNIRYQTIFYQDKLFYFRKDIYEYDEIIQNSQI